MREEIAVLVLLEEVDSTLRIVSTYRAEKKSLQIVLSSAQAGPGRKVKQEQEEMSRNHVPILFIGSVSHFKLGIIPYVSRLPSYAFIS